jgi:hypothetical protein
MVVIDDSHVGPWGYGGHMIEVKIAGPSRCIDAFHLHGLFSDLFICSTILFEGCNAI